MALRYWFGSLLVIMGIGALVDQVYPFDFWHWFSLWWPLAIILLGALLILTRSATVFGSMLLILIGLIIQVTALGIAGNNFWNLFWPSLLILFGIFMIFRLGRITNSMEKSQEMLNNFVIFSGLETRFTNPVFRGGSITALFGGADIDVRESSLPQEGTFLELTVAFGGIVIKIPENWRVDINGLPFFGGWSNNARNQPGKEDLPILTVRCLALFGGIEIKN